MNDRNTPLWPNDVPAGVIRPADADGGPNHSIRYSIFQSQVPSAPRWYFGSAPTSNRVFGAYPSNAVLFTQPSVSRTVVYRPVGAVRLFPPLKIVNGTWCQVYMTSCWISFLGNLKGTTPAGPSERPAGAQLI